MIRINHFFKVSLWLLYISQALSPTFQIYILLNVPQPHTAFLLYIFLKSHIDFFNLSVILLLLSTLSQTTWDNVDWQAYSE